MIGSKQELAPVAERDTIPDAFVVCGVRVERVDSTACERWESPDFWGSRRPAIRVRASFHPDGNIGVSVEIGPAHFSEVASTLAEAIASVERQYVETLDAVRRLLGVPAAARKAVRS